jgi:hypothetical protein
MGDWDYINEHMGGHDSDGLPNFMSEPGFSDDYQKHTQQIQKPKPKKNIPVDWSSKAITEAVFKYYEDDGHVLKIYIEGQDNPIKCTSNHTGDYQLAVEYAKDLYPGEGVIYWSRGVNVYNPKEWFYRIERTAEQMPF